MTLIRFLLQSSYKTLLLCALAGAAGGAAGIALIALIQNELASEASSPGPMWLAFGAICLISSAARVLGQIGMVRLGQRSVARLGLSIVRRTLELPVERFQSMNSSSLLAALTEDIAVIASALVGIPQLCINVPIVIACLAYIGWLSPAILVSGLGCAALSIAAYVALSARASAQLREARAERDLLVDHYRTLIGGFRELKLHRGRRGAFLEELLEPTTNSVRDRMVGGLSSFAVAEGWSQLAFFGFIGIVLYAMPSIVPVTRATLISAVLIVLYLMGPIDIILNWVPVLGRARTSLDKLKSLLPELDQCRTGAALPSAPCHGLAFSRSLCLEGITFTYHQKGGDAGFTLGPIDLTLRPGEIVMVTGGNGAGKTTLAELVSGLYVPSSGRIRLDGRALAAEDREAYCQLFSVVFADGQLFSNLLGLPADDIKAKARDGLERLGLAEQVSLRGLSFSTVDLSQGQRGRLALLGAWLEDRPVYIFDEWAANQDPSFKRFFYRTLLPELKAAGKSVLVISHDTHYLDSADRLVRLQDGRLLEECTMEIGGGWTQGDCQEPDE